MVRKGKHKSKKKSIKKLKKKAAKTAKKAAKKATKAKKKAKKVVKGWDAWAEAPAAKDLAKHAVSAFRTAVDDDPTISDGRAKRLARRAKKAAAAQKRAVRK